VRVSAGAVPVELTSFTATPQRSEVELHWATATEVNTYGFEIERRVISGSSNQWQRVAFVLGASTSSSPRNYSYTDKNLAVGRYAYRLKQIDNDGTFKYSYSVEVSIEAPKTFSLEQNYPNPFNPSTTIQYQLPTSQFVTLKIYDMLGKEVVTLLSEQKDTGNYFEIWDASKYPSGIYFCRLQAGNFSAMKKFVLLK
jgi:transglutaminase-like putative cysteine protease